jgi:hypothetical protein
MISRKRLFACALANTPSIVRVITIRKGLCGRADCRRGHLHAPRPVNRAALQIFLHECAHFALHHGQPSKLPYLEEYEAEAWAIARMREASIPVPQKALRIARRNVAQRILRTRRSWLEYKIDARAARFAWGRHYRAWLRGIKEAFLCGDYYIYFCSPEIIPITAGPWPGRCFEDPSPAKPKKPRKIVPFPIPENPPPQPSKKSCEAAARLIARLKETK